MLIIISLAKNIIEFEIKVLLYDEKWFNEVGAYERYLDLTTFGFIAAYI